MKTAEHKSLYRNFAIKIPISYGNNEETLLRSFFIWTTCIKSINFITLYEEACEFVYVLNHRRFISPNCIHIQNTWVLRQRPATWWYHRWASKHGQIVPYPSK